MKAHLNLVLYRKNNERIIPYRIYPEGSNKHISPKIIELTLSIGFATQFSVFIFLMYILFIAIPVIPVTNRHTPIKQIKAIIIPIIAAKIGRKK